jgi:hypothetical protein
MPSLRITLLLAILLMVASCRSSSRIEFIERDDRIDILIDGETISSYRFSCDGQKPCLWPVRTPEGAVVTRGFPIEALEGESTDHRHHVGVFFTFEGVNHNNFWAPRETPPEIRHVRVLEHRSGSQHGVLAVLKHWVGADGRTLLEEEQTMRVTPGPEQYAIDFSMVLRAVDDTIVFTDTKEGMFAIRVADWMTERSGTGEYLSSNGDRTEQNIWGRRAEWVRLEGELEGRPRGVAFMNHPSSVNYPTYWHARGYGCFSANPLGQLDFQQAHQVEHPAPFGLVLEPGQEALFRYRLMVYDGGRTKEVLDQEFDAYRTL